MHRTERTCEVEDVLGGNDELWTHGTDDVLSTSAGQCSAFMRAVLPDHT